MKVSEVRRRIEEIRELAQSDPEAGHSELDDLYRDVLQHIAKGLEQSRGPEDFIGYADDCELAKAALEAENIKWRWFACA